MYAAAREAAKTQILVGQTKKGKPVYRVAYICAHCGKAFRDKGIEEVIDENGNTVKRKFRAEIAVDHIEPVIPVTGRTTWDDYIDRLFNGKLQILCNYKGIRDGKKSCHALKTLAENRERKRLNPKEKKPKTKKKKDKNDSNL